MENEKIVVYLQVERVFPFRSEGPPPVIPAGKLVLERKPNPMGVIDLPWLFVKGKQIGAAEIYWRSWDFQEFGEFRIEFL